MPPHRTSGKLTPQAQHALIRKYHISIQGPIRRQDWPQKYASIFSLVRDMERVSYDQYKEIDFADDSARRVAMFNLYNRVERLVAQAQKLREALDNEETWRLKTENLILERFETEVDCHVCGDRRWISDFQATSNCPTFMAQVNERRGNRKLCQCSESQRAKLLAEQTSHISFVTKGSCTFVDNSMPEIQKNILSRHRPDRVVGLGQTPELTHLLAANPRVLATVNGDESDMFFPFLVLEAKSEKNSVGFESIERQTVFPIRAMLGLQRALQEASRVQTDPLVWFLANRGDEWRIYGCVPNSHRIQIIDLWHGSILRHDSALQLLLVVDLLCDWARDIYMDRVVAALQHLAGPEIPAMVSQDSFEVVAPSATAPRDPTTTQHQLDSETSRAPPAAPHVESAEPQVKSEATDTVIESVPVSDTEDEDASEETIPESSQVQPGPQKGESRGPYLFEPEYWQQYIALRAGSSIQLRFRCLSLPESVYGLTAMLKHIDNDADVSQTAHKMLVLFQPIDPLVVDTYFLNRIRRCWGAVERPSTAGDSRRIYICLHWRASFDYVDWMLIKELAVITASEAAMSFLISLANMSRVYGFLRRESTKIAKQLIRPLRYMPLPELVQAAARNQFLYLKPSDGKVTSKGWSEDREKADFSARLWKCRDAPLLRQCYDDDSISKSFHQWSNVDPPVKLPRALRLEDDTAEYDGVALLRISPGVRVTKPEYCIFSYQSQIAPNPQQAGRKMLSLLRNCPDVFFGTRRCLGGQDRLYLRALAKLLIDIPEDKW